MAKKATGKKPKENQYGIDRWTSNGYGLKVLSVNRSNVKKANNSAKKEEK